MLTLKFFAESRIDGKFDGTLAHVISAHSYQVYERNNGVITITALDSDGRGIDFHIAPIRTHNEYEYCFVENIKGKTIEKYVSQLSVEQYQDICKPKVSGPVTKSSEE